MRSHKSNNPVPSGYAYHQNSVRGFSPIDPQKLGFRGYQQSRYSSRNQNYSRNRPGPPQDDYVYNPNDYPELPNKQTSHVTNRGYVPNNQQGFLELAKTIQEVKEAQMFFHQELMSLRTQFMVPTRVQNATNQPMYNEQPQFQSIPQVNHK